MAGKNFYSLFFSFESCRCLLLTMYYIVEAWFVNLFKKPKKLKDFTALHICSKEEICKIAIFVGITIGLFGVTAQIFKVSGSGRGLGKDIAILLAEEGCRLICVDIDEENAKKTAEQINEKYQDKAIAIKLDVTDRSAVYNLEKKLRECGEQIDLLVNNAGIVKAAPLFDESDEMIEKILNVNLISQFWMVKAFLPEMLKRNKGHIVSISSMIAFSCTANTIPYAASKYGVTGFMYSLREELRRKRGCDIKTTTVHPYFLDSSPHNVQHWKVDSKIPDLSIRTVAKYVVKGIKYEDVVVSIPALLYWCTHFLRFLPMKANDLWMDAYYANVDALQKLEIFPNN